MIDINTFIFNELQSIRPYAFQRTILNRFLILNDISNVKSDKQLSLKSGFMTKHFNTP